MLNLIRNFGCFRMLIAMVSDVEIIRLVQIYRYLDTFEIVCLPSKKDNLRQS